MNKLIFLTVILALFTSCSTKSEKKEGQNRNNKIETGYSFQKLDPKELYQPQEQKVIEEKINLSFTKETNSIFYVEDEFDNETVYVSRSPYQVFNIIQNLEKISDKDKVLYLKYALQLGKDEKLASIISYLEKDSFPLEDFYEAIEILKGFDKNSEAINLLQKRASDLISKKVDKKDEDNIISTYYNLLSKIKEIKDSILEDVNFNAETKKVYELYKENVIVFSKYLDVLEKEKNFTELERVAKESISNPKLKQVSIQFLASLAEKNGEDSGILYEKYLTLPEDQYLFENYINSLKDKKRWAEKSKEFSVNYYKNPTLDSFYKLYFSLNVDGKTQEIKKLLLSFKEFLYKNENELWMSQLADIFLTRGFYSESYELLNTLLIKYPNGETREKNIVNMINTLQRKNYPIENKKSLFNFNTPDVIGGLLSLYQNSLYNDDFLTETLRLEKYQERLSDIKYIFETFKNDFKNMSYKKDFLFSYLAHLYSISSPNRDFFAFELAQKESDLDIKLALLPYAYSKDRKVQILDIYKEVLEKQKDDNTKFASTFNKMISFVKSYYASTEVVNILYEYLDSYSDKELVYQELLTVLDQYRFFAKESDIYKRALKKFDTNSWRDQFARFLLRNYMYKEILSFSDELLNSKDANYFVEFLRGNFTSSFYGEYNKPYNLMYEEIYLKALEKYPFNNYIVQQLLSFYRSFYPSNYYRSNYKAEAKYKKLRNKYMFIRDYLRSEYFAEMQRVNPALLETILERVERKEKKNLPELIFEAEMNVFKNHFEKAVKSYKILSSFYVTDERIISQTAKILKSLASSFYIQNPEYLTDAELFFKRLTFLNRKSVKTYISLAELYYELNNGEKASKTLFRALEYQKNNPSLYEEIANVFYDYYNYENAIKTLAIYQTRNKKPNSFLSKIGRLYELKNQPELAYKYYADDIFENGTEAFESEKMLKRFYQREQKYQKNVVNYINSKKSLFYTSVTTLEAGNSLLLYMGLKKDRDELFSEAIEKSSDLDVLNYLFRFYQQNKNNENAEKTLLKLESLQPKSEDILYFAISFYQKQNRVDKILERYKKLISMNSIENDRYQYQSILDNYWSYLVQAKKIDLYIESLKERISIIPKNDSEERIYFTLQLQNLYLENKKYSESREILDNLQKEFPIDQRVVYAIFNWYDSQKDIKGKIDYLKSLMKSVSESKEFSFYQKRDLIASYRSTLIDSLKKEHRYTEVQDQYIEILNKNPFDYSLYTAYVFSKSNNILNRMLDFYEKTVKKSFKDHRFMLLLANIYEWEKNYEKAIFHFENALKIEPQSLNIITNIARLYEASKNYQKAFDIYLKIQQREDQKFHRSGWNYTLLKLSLKLKNREKIMFYLKEIAGDSSDYKDKTDTGNIKTVLSILYDEGAFEYAEPYYEKLFVKASLQQKQYFPTDALYPYFILSIRNGKLIDFMDKILYYYDEITRLYNNQTDYYVKNSNLSSLLYAISNYLPDNIHYLTDLEQKTVNDYLVSKEMNADSKTLQEIANYYLKTYQFKKYGELLPKLSRDGQSRYNYWIADFYRQRAMWDEILSEKTYSSSYKSQSNGYKAVISYVLERNSDYKTAIKALYDDCHNYSGNGVDLYLSLMFKNRDSFKSLFSKNCRYSQIYEFLISKKEKELLFELIDSNISNSNQNLISKISVLNRLSLFNDEGISLYKKLLGVEKTVKQQIEDEGNDSLLNSDEWSSHVKNYANYLLKTGKSDVEDYLLNVLEVRPKSQEAYLEVASVFIENKNYQKGDIFYQYANKLKKNESIEILILENYNNLKDDEKFKLTLSELLQTTNLSVINNLFLMLKRINRVDSYTLQYYWDTLLDAISETNGSFYQYQPFFTTLINYHLENNQEELLLSFFKKIKKDFFAISLEQIIQSPKFSHDLKISLMESNIDYYVENENFNSAKYWLNFVLQYTLELKDGAKADILLKKYSSLFGKDEERIDSYKARVFYLQKNWESLYNYLFIDPIVSENHYDNEYGESEYNGEGEGDYQGEENGDYEDTYEGRGDYNDYYDSVISKQDLLRNLLITNSDSLRDEFVSLYFEKISNSNKLTLNDKIVLTTALPTESANLYLKRLLLATTYIYDIRAIKSHAMSIENLELFYQALNREFEFYFNNFSIVKKYSGSDEYPLFIENLALRGDKEGLIKSLKTRPLSINEWRVLTTTLNTHKKSIAEKTASFNYENENLEDLKYLSAINMIKLNKFKESLQILDSLKDSKFSILKWNLVAMAKISQNEYNGSTLEAIKKALYYSPQQSFYIMLAKYYISIKDNKKGFYALYLAGLGYFRVENLLVTEYLNGSYINYDTYNEYDDYYGDLASKVRKLIEKSKSQEKENALETFFNRYSLSKEDRELFLNFFYQEYKELKDPKFGALVLKVLSKDNSNYKNEYETLLKNNPELKNSGF
ncbi:hypothetical protein JXR93_09950 [bacterium]|nr:hypothetical protein [bacterium]